MQPNDLQYIIIKDSKEFILPTSPDGWDDTVISWVRSETYTGLIRNMAVPMKFPLDGAWLIREKFYTDGIEGRVQLKINKLNRSTWVYEQLFLGDLDLSMFEDGAEFVEVTAMEAGISSRVKAYEGIKYTFPMDEAIDVELPGLKLLETATFLLTSGAQYPLTLNNQVLFPLMIIQNETKSVEASAQEVEFTSLGQPPLNLTTSDKWFYKATVNGDIRFQGFVEGSNFMIYVRDETGVILRTIGGSAGGQYFKIPFDFTLTVTAGKKLFLTGTTFVIGGPTTMYDGEISASYTTISPPSIIKAFRPKYLFDQLIKKMNGTEYPTQSFHLDRWRQLVITSGEAIRGIRNPKLKTSFKDFFTSINAVTNAGFGTENNKAVLEAKDYFFRNIEAFDLGEVKKFNLTPNKSDFYSSIKVGYPDQNYDEINGRQEFNSEQIHSTPITRVQRELDLLSIYRADIYGIEFLRINLEGKSTTDNSSDNDVFFIFINDQEEPGQDYFRPEPSTDFANVSGVAAGDTAYNLRISPKRNLFRHGNYLHAMLDKLGSYYINFESAKKNVDLASTDSKGFRVLENMNISIPSLDDPLFLPYLATISVDVPKDLQQIIDALPFGFIKFSFEDHSYKGYIIEASINSTQSMEREFKLLLTTDNDLLTLIR